MGIAALTALVGVCTPAIAEAADAPHAAGPSFGINSDGWTVRVTNHDDGADAHVKSTTFNNIDNAPEVISKGRTSNTVKGAAGLFGPADADITYAVGDGTAHLFLRSDLDGTTHHHCDVTGNAKCIIDPTPKDTPLEVHISSHTGIDWGENRDGWKVKYRNLTGEVFYLQGCTDGNPKSTEPCRTDIGNGEEWFYSIKTEFDKNRQTPATNSRATNDRLFTLVDENGRKKIATPENTFHARFDTDAVGRIRHTCSTPSGFHCDITPDNADPNGRQKAIVVTYTKLTTAN